MLRGMELSAMSVGNGIEKTERVKCGRLRPVSWVMDVSFEYITGLVHQKRSLRAGMAKYGWTESHKYGVIK